MSSLVTPASPVASLLRTSLALMALDVMIDLLLPFTHIGFQPALFMNVSTATAYTLLRQAWP
jgi:hypothetical protein